MSGPIVLAAGGTGGHMIPAQALAHELITRRRALVLITDRRGRRYGGALETIETVVIRAATLTGLSLIGRLRVLAAIVLGTLQARRVLARLKPAAVVGFGGYPSLPTMMAANRARVPTVIHEQNALLGRVNRFLARRATALALSVPETLRVSSRDHPKARVVGNPVRSNVAAVGSQPYQPPQAEQPISLLIFGGSQGATILARVVPAALAHLPAALRARLRVSQQCRPEDLTATRKAYAEADIAAETTPYFEDLPMRLAAAQLVIARAGASTIAELTAAGRPAILVPYPSATDDHQTANAGVLNDAGAAWLMPQADLSSTALGDLLRMLLPDGARLIAAAAAAHRLGRRDAARSLADLVEAVEARAEGNAP